MPNPSDDMNNLFRLIAFAALKEMDLSEMKGIELRSVFIYKRTV